MPFGFLCCGPTTVANVVDTSEDDSSDYCEVVRGGGGDGLRTPVGMVVDDSGLRHRRRISGSSSSSEEIGFMARFTSTFFSPRPARPRRRTKSSTKKTSYGSAVTHFSDDGRQSHSPMDVEVEVEDAVTVGHTLMAISGAKASRTPRGRAGSDPAVLNLAFRETSRLPDVAGRERVEWAAGIVKIDLTETGIRTLHGLDGFPNVRTLVLDSNGLLSLPDCPWVPSLEELWLCHNEIDNLDGLLCQVNDTFPRLNFLALMGNPCWPADPSRYNAPGSRRNRRNRRSRRNSRLERKSSDEAERAAGPPFSFPSSGGDTSSASSRHKQGRRGRWGSRGGVDDFGDVEEREEQRRGMQEEELLYRIRVIRRIPGLQTLDCEEVTAEERARAAQEQEDSSEVEMNLSLDPDADATTDVEEESLQSAITVSVRDVPERVIVRDISSEGEVTVHGVGKEHDLLESERARRRHLADRSTLPSTWTKEPVVMDVGTGWAKMGLAGQDKPSCMFPSIVGRVDMRAYDQITGQEERVYVGHEAVNEASKRIAERDLPTGKGPMPKPILLNHPLDMGVVTDWDDMEEIWRHGIEDVMGLDAVEHPVLMADSTATPSGAREKATEILFETLTTPAMHMALQPVLALYACGPSSGLIVDIGDSGTQIAPIFDGFLLEKGVRQLQLGGRDVTEQLAASINAKVGLLGGGEYDRSQPIDMLKLEDAKKKMCFVSENVDKDNARMELSMTKPHVLPDGTRITLGRERYRCSEILFDPTIALRQEASLQTSILDSILACERKTWAILAQTVILTGGTSELAGFNRRLQRELTKARRASGIKLKFTVMVPEDDHNHTVWLGGSMLASTGQLDGLWFTRAEYEEYGAGPIHAKFAA